VTYDVGFFVGIGTGFFTFFSLTEHLVFTLQSIPYFVPPVLVLLLWYAGGWFGARSGERRGAALVETIKAADPATRRKLIDSFLRKAKRYQRIIKPLSCIVIVVLGVSFAFAGFYTQGVLLIGLAIYVYFDDSAIKANFTATCVAVSIFSLVLTFAIGVQRARGILTNGEAATENIYIDDKVVPARLIRGGDKGVLFLSVETKKIRFVRWESIKQIQTL
jgi:hypothetical protein